MNDIRLIDANALKTEMADDLAATIRMSEMRKTDMAVRVLNKIDEANTIDAVHVVHGRWVKSNKHIWRKTQSGEVDEFWNEYEYHNGPGCEVCGFSFCEHCDPEKWDDETCEDHYVCSVCGRIEMKAEPYCNCGAKMDGGADDV